MEFLINMFQIAAIPVPQQQGRENLTDIVRRGHEHWAHWAENTLPVISNRVAAALDHFQYALTQWYGPPRYQVQPPQPGIPAAAVMPQPQLAGVHQNPPVAPAHLPLPPGVGQPPPMPPAPPPPPPGVLPGPAMVPARQPPPPGVVQHPHVPPAYLPHPPPRQPPFYPVDWLREPAVLAEYLNLGNRG